MNSLLYYAKETEFEMQATTKRKEDLDLLQAQGRVTKSDLPFTKISVVVIKMNWKQKKGEK